jgi:hypothetical protein
MKISHKIKSLFRRRPPTAGQLAARAEAKSELGQIKTDLATRRNPTDSL